MSSSLSLEAFKNSSIPWFVLDVRSPEEYAQGSLPGAHLIPLAELASRLSELPEATPIVTLCTKGGGRSEQAADFLLGQGKADVYFLAGGYNGFIEARSS